MSCGGKNGLGQRGVDTIGLSRGASYRLHAAYSLTSKDTNFIHGFEKTKCAR